MKTSELRRCLYRSVLLAVIIAAGLQTIAFAQMPSPALMIQKSPPEGGTVTPAGGVHRFDLNSEVSMTAVAKPGYVFVCWLGDVSDPVSNSTFTTLDAPKIVIAVFERAEHDLLAAVAEIPQSSGSRGGLRGSAADYSKQGYSGGGAKRPHKFRFPSFPDDIDTPDDDDDDDDIDEDPIDFPVPDIDGDVPVPPDTAEIPVPQLPEPGTIFLLGGGIPMLLRRKRNPKR